MLARFLKQSFAVEASFYAALHEALYETYNTSASNSSLAAVVDLIITFNSKGIPFHILTYNYDDLLEQRLLAIGIPHNTIFDDDSFAEATHDIKIFHPHGFVPESGDPLLHRDLIILAEDEYHRLYSDSFAWANHIQLSKFRESSCLFVGFSMNDPSVRRLLDAVSLSGNQHYCIVKRAERSGRLTKKDARFLDAAIGLALLDLRITTLLIDKYDELGPLLSAISA